MENQNPPSAHPEPYRKLGQAEGIIRDLLHMLDRQWAVVEFDPSNVEERARAFVANSKVSS